MQPPTERLLNGLPYRPSPTQVKAVEDVAGDVARGTPRMRRVLLGDVGSGKTTVAMAAIVEAKCRYPAGQAVYMAPTCELARQTMKKMAPHLTKMRMKVAYLASASTGDDRAAAADADAVFATHAYLSEKFRMKDVVLLVIDEQQRFGVEHRALAASKARRKRHGCHLLVLSATPIPRTTEQLRRGMFDVTAIDRHTPNRTRTEHLSHDDVRTIHPDVLDEIADRVRRRQRVFVVYAAVDVDKNDSGRLADLQTGAMQIRRAVGRNKVVTAHGRMTPSERDEAFEEFNRGKALVLAATTVIEVGIDVPDAKCIVIHNAESFGAAQLHQLRGRVGRDGSPDALCLLVSFRDTEKGSKRIRSVKNNSDGFRIFDDDRDQRGPGNPEGTEQKGHDHEDKWDAADADAAGGHKNTKRKADDTTPCCRACQLNKLNNNKRRKCRPTSSKPDDACGCARRPPGRPPTRPRTGRPARGPTRRRARTPSSTAPTRARSTSTTRSSKRTTTPSSGSSRTTRSTRSSKGRTRPRPGTR